MPTQAYPLLPADIAKVNVPQVDLFGGFFQGQEQYQKQQLQNLFPEGIPIDPKTGLPDYRTMANRITQVGGVAQLPTALGLINQDYLQRLPPIGGTTPAPAETPPRPNPAPISMQRPPGQATSDTAELAGGGGQRYADEGGGEPKPPGQNLVQPDEVPGSFQVTKGPVVGREPQQATALAATPAPDTSSYPPQLVPGPPTGRFTQVAQAQPQPTAQPRSQIQGIPAQQTGPYNEALAKQYDQEFLRNLELARRAGLVPGGKEAADAYRQDAIKAYENAKMIREGLIGAQRKQAETQVEQEKAILDEGRKAFHGADETLFHLGHIDQSIKELGPNWMGAGANQRATLARQFNTALQFIPEPIQKEFGLTPFDPKAISNWESFNKQTQQLGFAQARMLGNREAQQIIQAAVSSVPNAEQTYWGARLVSAGMRQGALRQKDYFNALIEARRSGQSLLDADINFNQTHPLQSYIDKATSVVPPQRAIQYLQQNPTPANKKFFDKTYGDGASIGVFGPNK